MDNVINMANATGNGTMQTPEQALQLAMDDIGNCGALKKGKKLLILALDETNDQYDISFIQAGMKMSECLALCEAAKIIFLEEMGHISTE